MAKSELKRRPEKSKNQIKTILLIGEGKTEKYYCEGLIKSYLKEQFSKIGLMLKASHINGKINDFDNVIKKKKEVGIVGAIGIFDLDIIVNDQKESFVEEYVNGKYDGIPIKLLLTYPNIEAWILGHFSTDFFKTSEKDIKKRVQDKLSPGNNDYKSDAKIYEKIQSKVNFVKDNIKKTVFHVAKDNFEKKNNKRVYAHPLTGVIDNDMKNTIHSI